MEIDVLCIGEASTSILVLLKSSKYNTPENNVAAESQDALPQVRVTP